MTKKTKRLTLLVAAALAAMLVATSCGNSGTKSANKQPDTVSSIDASSAAEPQSTASDYVASVYTDTGYESEWLNLKFTAPEGFTMTPQAQLQKLMGASMDEMDLSAFQKILTEAKIKYEMMVQESTAGAPNLIVLAEKLPLSSYTVEQYFDELKKQLLANTAMNYTFDGELTEATVGGMTFQKAIVSGSSNGAPLKQDMYMAKQGDYMVSMTMTYTDGLEAQCDALLAGFQPLA